jgi:hypothetical protein
MESYVAKTCKIGTYCIWVFLNVVLAMLIVKDWWGMESCGSDTEEMGVKIKAAQDPEIFRF